MLSLYILTHPANSVKLSSLSCLIIRQIISESTSSTTGAIDVSFEVHDANMEIVDLNEEITYGRSYYFFV